MSDIGWGEEWGFLWPGGESSFDFEALGISRLWKQLDYATQVRAFVSIMAQTWSDVDGATMGELARVGIDAATGDELDDWGARIGPTLRNGMGDDLYRRVIKVSARKAINQADPQTIYDIVRIFSDGNAKITLAESFPANWVIWLHFLTLEEQAQVTALMDGVPGLGIGAQAIVVDPDGVFQWGSTTGSVTVTRHWSSTTGSVPSSESAGFASVRVIQ
jgi:hypothetical protein